MGPLYGAFNYPSLPAVIMPPLSPSAPTTPMPLAVKITMAAANSLLLFRGILDVSLSVVVRRFHFSINSSLGGRWEQDICLVARLLETEELLTAVILF